MSKNDQVKKLKEFEDGEELDIKDALKSTDFGGAYGIGVIYKFNLMII